MALILSMVLLLQEDFTKSFDAIVARLKSTEIAARDEARRDLAKLVKSDRKTARPFLRDRIAVETDPEIKSTLQWAQGELVTFDDVKMELVIPGESVTLKRAKSGDPLFTLKITNANDVAVRLYESWSLQVSDAEGKKLAIDHNLGRWGMRRGGCFLAQHHFVTIESGKSVELKVSVKDFDLDQNIRTGFKIESEGVYTVKLSFEFKREAFRSMCRDGCKDHEAATQPWNLAIEGERTVEAKLTVKD